MPVTDAQARLLALKAPLQQETIDLLQSIGRYLSDDILARRDQPAAPLSAMDGYAIRFADLPGPWTLAGQIAAGGVPPRALRPGETMRIFTGAMLPEGADTVVVQEDIDVAADKVALVGEGPANARRHVRERAGDFATDDLLVRRGSRLTAGALAAVAMSGAGHVPVGRRVRIAIVTTGDELVPPGRPLGPGQIPDSNGVMLAAMLATEPTEVGLPHHVADNRQTLANVLKDLARHHDVIVTIGGASVGDHDHVQGAITDAGGTIDFWKIAMRPGKPLLAATLGDAVVLGLPGNPASAFVTATLFLLPLVRHLAGADAPLPPIYQAPLAMPLAAGGDRRDYMRATLRDGQLMPLTQQDSGQTRPLADANALVVREINAPASAKGDMAAYIAIQPPA